MIQRYTSAISCDKLTSSLCFSFSAMLPHMGIMTITRLKQRLALPSKQMVHYSGLSSIEELKKCSSSFYAMQF